MRKAQYFLMRHFYDAAFLMRSSTRCPIIIRQHTNAAFRINRNFRFPQAAQDVARLHRLKNSALFSALTPLELKIVDGLLHERRYLTDEIVFDEDEEGQALYLIMSGRVVINKLHQSSNQVVAQLEPGSFFDGVLHYILVGPMQRLVRAGYGRNAAAMLVALATWVPSLLLGVVMVIGETLGRLVTNPRLRAAPLCAGVKDAPGQHRPRYCARAARAPTPNAGL